jgi:hypothetical protein
MYDPKELNQIIDKLNHLALVNKDNDKGEIYAQMQYLAQTITIELDKLHNAINNDLEDELPTHTTDTLSNIGKEY